MTVGADTPLPVRENAAETPQDANPGRCEWCRKPLRGMRPDARFCSPSHRLAKWRYDRDPETAPPPPARRGGPSGPQLSYAKGVAAMAAGLIDAGWERDCAVAFASYWLGRALPERQRARMMARNGNGKAEG